MFFQSGRNRVMLVDDDDLNMMILQEILKNEYELLTVDNGKDALEKALDFRPDVILLDVMMPGIDGYETCRRLRADDRLKFTKIILVSAHSLLKNRLDGYQVGADDYVVKPFNADELLAKVRVFIRLKSVEEIDQLRGDLLSVFSHETRSPLNTIIGFAKLLEENHTLSDDEREGINFILESSHRLIELADKAILLSNLRTQSRDIGHAAISLTDIAGAAVESRRAKFAAAAVNLKYEPAAGDKLMISGDAELLEKATAYLLDNAMRFSNQGDEVEVACSRRRDDRLEIRVKDRGEGLADDFNAIFDAFAVGDTSHHRDGHGLSLAVVKYVMDAHGGRALAANNSDGRGCSFRLTFPPLAD